MIRPGTPPGSGQPSSSTLSTETTWSASHEPFVRCQRKMLLDSAAPTNPSIRVRVVEPSDLERDQPGLAEVDCLVEPSLGQIPEVQPLSVPAGFDVRDVEALLVGVRLAELRRDEHVLARLVPEVVVERRPRAAVLPAALQLECPGVDHGEAARAAAVAVAEHAHHDALAGHAVDRVRTRVARLLDQLVPARSPSR